ncbi:MAG: hypothetical protein AAGC55_02395 [Myxococcota bacterium]
MAVPATFAHLPRAFAVLLPEMAELSWPGEVRSDCTGCVMTPAVSGESPSGPWSFHPDGRCCTYHPGLPNFLAGQALAGGGRGAELLRARIARGPGVTAWGVRPSAVWRERYTEIADDRFGRDLSLRCPYWVGGDLACGIWGARPSTCRTWHCKHDHGLRSAVVWSQLQHVLTHIESLLAGFCIERGQPPTPGSADATAEAWSAWYGQCATIVDRIDRADLAALADPLLIQARADLATLVARRRTQLPEIVVPAIEGTWPEPHGIRVSGYSRYDTVIAPRSLFAFLSRLDGTTSWRAAQAAVLDDGGEAISDELVAELFRIGAVEAPGSPSPTVIDRQRWPLPVLDAAEHDRTPEGLAMDPVD